MMSRVAGLPSNPRARLASSHDSSRGRQVVYQPPSQLDNSRSLRSTSASRARQPPTQSMEKDTRRAQSRPRALPIERPDPRSTRNSSVSSASSSLTSGSSASSFWEKGSVRSYSTSASENNEELESKPIDTSEGSVLGTLLDTTYYWNRATEAATVLSQGVSKAWNTGVSSQLQDEREDDSHLLKVMRAYHLSKVKNPSDLPDWLFSARERGGKGSFAQTERSEEPVEQPMSSDRTQKQRRRQGQVSQPVPPVPLGSFSTDNGTTFSKGPSEAMTRRRPDGIERLKTLREQRRGQDIPRRF